MVLLLTKAQRKPFKAATVGALSMSLMGTPFAVPASFAVESPAPQQITAAQAQQVQGIPGQYQIRHSKDGKIFIAGSNRDMSVSTIARLDEKTLQIEAIATLPITRAGTGYNAGYKNLGAFGIDVDDENGTIGLRILVITLCLCTTKIISISCGPTTELKKEMKTGSSIRAR